MRELIATAGGAVRLVVGEAVRGWLRNLRAAAPALGTLYVVLLLAGAAALAGVAARQALTADLRGAAEVRVYLKQDVAAEDADRLRARLAADPRVTAVAVVPADRALAEARTRPGLGRLADAAGTNPFPARLDVRVVDLRDVAAVVRSVADDAAVDPDSPSSYDPGTYASLGRLLTVAGAVTLAALAVLALVAVAVTANAIRAGVLARREDLVVMRLLGARGPILVGPMVVEGALTGAVAGALAAAVLLGLFAGAEHASTRAFVALLPGVGWPAASTAAAALPGAGIALASLGALLGVRRWAA